jgi:hypothetical protein
MPLRMGWSLGIAVGALGGLCAGVAMTAGAVTPAAAPAASDYEIVRATFSAEGETAEGTARCTAGKFVFGGGGRVLGEGAPRYTLVASDPVGPSGWTAAFVRTPEAEPPPPLVPGSPPAEEEGETETDFEVSAVCAAMR